MGTRPAESTVSLSVRVQPATKRTLVAAAKRRSISLARLLDMLVLDGALRDAGGGQP